MGLVKLTAGDGYTHLTTSVAAHGAIERGPGAWLAIAPPTASPPARWVGSGLVEVGLADAWRYRRIDLDASIDAHLESVEQDDTMEASQ
jgi:hypothetical protein